MSIQKELVGKTIISTGFKNNKAWFKLNMNDGSSYLIMPYLNHSIYILNRYIGNLSGDDLNIDSVLNKQIIDICTERIEDDPKELDLCMKSEWIQDKECYIESDTEHKKKLLTKIDKEWNEVRELYNFIHIVSQRLIFKLKALDTNIIEEVVFNFVNIHALQNKNYFMELDPEDEKTASEIEESYSEDDENYIPGRLSNEYQGFIFEKWRGYKKKKTNKKKK